MTRPLSQRVFQLQQVLPFLLLIVVMLYEVTRQLAFQDGGNPALFAVESIAFGIVTPAVLWLALHWIGREVAARELAQDEADTRTRMMREMHHRIKNNLQTVADLLSLEMTRANYRAPDESLRDSVARIKCIAAAHELLSGDQINRVELGELARRVGESACAAWARPGQSITTDVEGAQLYLPSKAATAFALVINELVSNALEHGLAARPDGRIAITLEREMGEISVQVRDDGAGLPAGFNLADHSGLGLQITRTLVEKDLRGWFQLVNHAGTCAQFSFPVGEGERI